MAAPNVPYTAYKSKRHSRNLSAQLSPTSLSPASTPNQSRQTSYTGSVAPVPQDLVAPPWVTEKHDVVDVTEPYTTGGPPKVIWQRPPPLASTPLSDTIVSDVLAKAPDTPNTTKSPPPPVLLVSAPALELSIRDPQDVPLPTSPPPQLPTSPPTSPPSQNVPLSSSPNTTASVAGPSTIPHPKATRASSGKSVFRRLPSGAATLSPRTSSPLAAPPISQTLAPSHTVPASPLRVTQALPGHSGAKSPQRNLSLSPAPAEPLPYQSKEPISPVRSNSQTPDLSRSPPPNGTPTSNTSSRLGTPATPMQRLPSQPAQPTRAYYQPGFQPKGVYRPRTDEFLEIRSSKRAVGRVDRERLQRRLEKLIALHFPETSASPSLSSGGSVARRPHASPTQRRASSIFEMSFSDLRSKSAGDLLKGVMQTQAQATQSDIRIAEQTITPWEQDADVARCPSCTTSFHPLTNRKHHCRLCGRIVCALPVSSPKRPVTCSLLFIVDPLTGLIEEVEQGVDYGVKRQQSQSSNGKTDPKASKEEKTHPGVRICRICRPVLLHQEHIQEARSTPAFAKLYRTLDLLEKQIEDALPQFQELILALGDDMHPTKEASSARKQLLETFAQYDAVAKRIRHLPCPNGPGSSQDRVQAAIASRANLFLQKNMFPLQSLPRPAKNKGSASGTGSKDGPPPAIDPDSALAHALQPLLEQEALLESFVEEATVKRKFEDAKTLKANLKEIRGEIDRIVANADVEGGGAAKGR